MAYIGVDDIKATVAHAKQSGANILMENEVAEIGKFAMLSDPQGAVIALYQPARPAPDETDPAPMQFSWHELMTTDHLAALRFYSDLFGWKKQDEVDMGPMGKYVLFGRSNRPYGGMFNKPAEIPVPNWLLYVRVAGLDETLERVKKGGGKVLNGAMEVPGGDRVAQCMDPQGAAFALHESKK